MIPILENVKVPHTDLSEVTRVIFIEKNAVVMLSTSVTATTWVITVFADTSMPGADLSALFTVL